MNSTFLGTNTEFYTRSSDNYDVTRLNAAVGRVKSARDAWVEPTKKYQDMLVAGIAGGRNGNGGNVEEEQAP